MIESVSRPELLETGGSWALYDSLIDAIPDDILVTDYALGMNWSYVDSEAGCGVAYTASGGAKRGKGGDYRGAGLKDVAMLAKSWCFEEATLGVAALNAWYNSKSRIEASGLSAHFEAKDTVGYGLHKEIVGQKLDAFDLYRPAVEERGAALADKPKVVVVGHFPHVERILEYAQLTVLERKCSDALDTPDPACEYVMPSADFAFITGVTLINKTAPRLLTLAQNARVVMVGPSVIMAKPLVGMGVETLSGSIVTDPEALKFSVKHGTGKLFGKALQMCTIYTEGAPSLAAKGAQAAELL